MPSNPILQACAKHAITGMREWALNCTPGRELRNRLASVCLRTSSGSRRKFAIKLQEIEGNEEDLRVVTAMPQLIKARHATLVAAHCLAIDQAAAHLQFVHSLETMPSTRSGRRVPEPAAQ